MLSLAERMEFKQQKYRKFLQKKFHCYRGWQSFEYYKTLYLKLFDETSTNLIRFLLLEETFFECDEAVLNLLDCFLEKLVIAYDRKLHEDFERKVFFEEYQVISEVN
ncbi:hypothetical protein ACE4ZN_00660 [Enterococcus faecalis]|uniref:hypothetical protein n=1 Tax=Enterococcus faecalis TaxID=1351 RepID=UPI002241DF92